MTSNDYLIFAYEKKNAKFSWKHAILHAALLVYFITWYIIVLGQQPNIFYFHNFCYIIYIPIELSQCTKMGPLIGGRLEIHVSFIFHPSLNILKL